MSKARIYNKNTGKKNVYRVALGLNDGKAIGGCISEMSIGIPKSYFKKNKIKFNGGHADINY